MVGLIDLLFYSLAVTFEPGNKRGRRTYGKLIKARHARKRIIRNGSGSYYQLSLSYEHMNKRTYRVKHAN